MAKATRKAADAAARYSVGIDLGTTNSAMACADLTESETPEPIEVLPIPQLVEPGEVAPLTLLPSFLYVAGDFDFPADSLRLPWADEATGRRRSSASWRASAGPRTRRAWSRRPSRGCRTRAPTARRRFCRGARRRRCRSCRR